jgi:uncharacterized protein
MREDAITVDLLTRALPETIAVYRFGSTADGTSRPDSDLDYAILTPRGVDAAKLSGLREDLEGRFIRDVDLVDLRAASVILQAEVVARGRRPYARDEAAAERFEDFAFASYARLGDQNADIIADMVARGSVLG